MAIVFIKLQFVGIYEIDGFIDFIQKIDCHGDWAATSAGKETGSVYNFLEVGFLNRKRLSYQIFIHIDSFKKKNTPPEPKIQIYPKSAITPFFMFFQL